MRNKKIFIILLSLLLSLVFAAPAFAQGPDGAQVVFGNNLEVTNETTLNRDVVVFGGMVLVDETSQINGDMAVFGGNVDIQGVVDGDMIVFGGNVSVSGTIDGDVGLVGGNINLGETAVVKGDIGLVGGQPNVAEGAVIEGEIRGPNQFDFEYGPGHRNDEVDGPAAPPIPPVPPVPDFPQSGSGFLGLLGRIVSDTVWTISLLVTLGVITWVVAAFMPEQMMNARQTILESAPLSFGVGLISWLVAAVSFALILTICLAFVPVVALAVLGIATLFGWIVVGQMVGERLLVASGQSQPNFILASIVGVWVLTVVTNMPIIGQIPCIGWLLGLAGFLAGLVISLTGLGAVLLTRFGTRPYAPATYPYSSRGPSYSPGGGGRRVRWAEPAPDVSVEERVSSEDELRAKIKAALDDADKAAPEPAEAAGETEPDEDNAPGETPKKRGRRKKSDDAPEEKPEE